VPRHLPRMAEFAIAAVLIVAVSVCFASLQHVWAYMLSCGEEAIPGLGHDHRGSS
jgi:hypothetical protein